MGAPGARRDPLEPVRVARCLDADRAQPQPFGVDRCFKAKLRFGNSSSPEASGWVHQAGNTAFAVKCPPSAQGRRSYSPSGLKLPHDQRRDTPRRSRWSNSQQIMTGIEPRHVEPSRESGLIAFYCGSRSAGPGNQYLL
jgi:hypothetical protein